MNDKLLRSVHFDYLHPVFVIMGFETCVKEAGCCFLKVALDVFEKRKYSGSFSEKRIILSEATRLIISRSESFAKDEESLIANEIAALYRMQTGTWYLTPTHDDSQTPCIFDGINIKEKISESPGTKSICGVFAVISKRLLEFCNCLILRMKSLITWRRK